MNTFFHGSLLSLRFKKLTKIDTMKIHAMNIIICANATKTDHFLSKVMLGFLQAKNKKTQNEINHFVQSLNVNTRY